MALDAVATSESALLRALERLKATAGPGTVHHSSDSLITGDTDDSEDEHDAEAGTCIDAGAYAAQACTVGAVVS